MPHAVRREIFIVDRNGEIEAATEVDRAEANRAGADRARAVTVGDGTKAAVEGIIENTQKTAHTKTCRYDREANIRIGIIETTF